MGAGIRGVLRKARSLNLAELFLFANLAAFVTPTNLCDKIAISEHERTKPGNPKNKAAF